MSLKKGFSGIPCTRVGVYIECLPDTCSSKLHEIRLMDKTLHDLNLNYGIYGTILYLGHAEFCPSTVCLGALGLGLWAPEKGPFGGL